MAKSAPQVIFTPRLISVSLLIVVAGLLLAYWPVHDFSFVAFDDGDYIYENPMVCRGLSFAGLKWAFTSFHSANWHPLTWLSHMLDVSLFGLNPGPHHLVSLFLHICNSLLLFAVLYRLTRATGLCLLLTAFFAWHPLRVESVAWVSERKDLLCAFFWLSTIWLYSGYAKKTTVWHYLAVFFSTALALMAKPMAVTLPFVLLLLDYWPLKRFPQKSWAQLSLEKILLFILVLLSSFITFKAQSQAGAVAAESLGLIPRISHAGLSYLKYIELFFLPASLSILYPYDSSATLTLWGYGAWGLLIALTLWIYSQRAKQPYLITGWFWFLGTLVPVIGLVQVGGQAWADRYTYIPSIGFGILLIWLINDLSSLKFKRMVFSAASAMLVIFLFLTNQNIGAWRNSITLFSQAVKVNPKNFIAYSNLGQAYEKSGNWPAAMDAFQEALTISPNDQSTLLNFAQTLRDKGHFAQAEKTIRKALTVNPQKSPAYISLGVLYKKQGKLAEAERYMLQALEIEPDLFEASYNLGVIKLSRNQISEALAYLQKAIALKPANLEARVNLGVAYARSKELKKAAEQFKYALRLNPSHQQAAYNLKQIERLLSP